jgi:hypothetical protein
LIFAVTLTGCVSKKAPLLKQEDTVIPFANSTATVLMQKEIPTQNATQVVKSMNSTATEQVKATLRFQATEKAKVRNLDRANLPATGQIPMLYAEVVSLKIFSYIDKNNDGAYDHSNEKYGSDFTLDEIDGVCGILQIKINSKQTTALINFEFFGPDSSVAISERIFDSDLAPDLYGCLYDEELLRGSYILSVFNMNTKVAKGTFTIH